MYTIVEGYRYQTEAAKAVLQKVHPLEQDRAISMYYVGYYYSNELNDTIFFLPKVVVDEKGKLFGNPKYDPEELIHRYTKQLVSYCRSIGSRLGLPVEEAVIWSFNLECEVPIDLSLADRPISG